MKRRYENLFNPKSNKAGKYNFVMRNATSRKNIFHGSITTVYCNCSRPIQLSFHVPTHVFISIESNAHD
jgi:hypothetical protein